MTVSVLFSNIMLLYTSRPSNGDDFYFWRYLWQELLVITVWEDGKGKGGGRNREEGSISFECEMFVSRGLNLKFYVGGRATR